MKTFVSWLAEDVRSTLERLRASDKTDEIRQVDQAVDQVQEIWSSWSLSGGGSQVSTDEAGGTVEVSADRLGEVQGLRKRASKALQSRVSVGIGMRTSEAVTALRVATARGGDRVVLYEKGIESELAEKTEKAERPLRPASPQSPVASASAHSEASAAMAVAEDSERPPQPERTHAAADMVRQLHELAWRQRQDDRDSGQGPAIDPEAQKIRGRVGQVLQMVKQHADVLQQLRQQSPDAYGAVVALVQSVIQMARALPGGQAVAKSEPVNVMDGVSDDETHELARRLGVDLHQVRPDEFARGVAHEREHAGVVEADAVKIAQIAHDHLLEDPHYYTRLSTVTKGELLEKMALLHDDAENPRFVYRIESDVGDGPYSGIPGIAPKDDSIRRPVPQYGDEFPYTDIKRSGLLGGDFFVDQDGKTLYQPVTRPKFAFARPEDAVEWMGPKHMAFLEKAGFHLRKVPASKVWISSSGRQVMFHPHPTYQKGEGEVVDWRQHRVARKDWKPFGDDPGDVNKTDLPAAPKPPTSMKAKLHLPVGSVVTAGPTGKADPHDGHMKVRHGDGSTSDKQMRAGQITAVTDRFAPPTMGQGSHPTSSRNPTGR